MEKRKYPRVYSKFKFHFRPAYSYDSNWKLGWVGNLSLSGALVRLPRVFPMGSKIALKLPLEFSNRGTTVCVLWAVIVRLIAKNSIGECLMGISFDHQGIESENQKVALSRYVKEYSEGKKSSKDGSSDAVENERTSSRFNGLIKNALQEIECVPKRKKGFLSRIFKRS